MEFAAAPTAGATLGVQSSGRNDALALRLYAAAPGNLTLLRAHLAADLAEGNDTAVSAYYLGTVAELTGLTLHTTGDNDWYRFTVPAGISNLPRKLTIVPSSKEMGLGLVGRLEQGNGTLISGRIATDPAMGVMSIDLEGLTPSDYRFQLTGSEGARTALPLN